MRGDPAQRGELRATRGEPSRTLITPGNIDLAHRPRVRNRDGSISTVRSASFGTDQGEVLVPMVVGGRVVSVPAAIAHYFKTGEHLGVFRTPAAATAYAKRLHRAQADAIARNLGHR